LCCAEASARAASITWRRHRVSPPRSYPGGAWTSSAGAPSTSGARTPFVSAGCDTCTCHTARPDRAHAATKTRALPLLCALWLRGIAQINQHSRSLACVSRAWGAQVPRSGISLDCYAVMRILAIFWGSST
jgi:hypothetical protein